MGRISKYANHSELEKCTNALSDATRSLAMFATVSSTIIDGSPRCLDRSGSMPLTGSGSLSFARSQPETTETTPAPTPTPAPASQDSSSLFAPPPTHTKDSTPTPTPWGQAAFSTDVPPTSAGPSTTASEPSPTAEAFNNDGLFGPTVVETTDSLFPAVPAAPFETSAKANTTAAFPSDSLFPAPASNSTNPSPTNTTNTLFEAPKQDGGSLFAEPTGGALFGTFAAPAETVEPAAVPAGGDLFGTGFATPSESSPTGGDLFGTAFPAPEAAEPTPTGGDLFGKGVPAAPAPRIATPVGDLFASENTVSEPPTASGDLFKGVPAPPPIPERTATPVGDLFGAPSTETVPDTGGNLFATFPSETTESAGTLFGAATPTEPSTTPAVPAPDLFSATVPPSEAVPAAATSGDLFGAASGGDLFNAGKGGEAGLFPEGSGQGEVDAFGASFTSPVEVPQGQTAVAAQSSGGGVPAAADTHAQAASWGDNTWASPDFKSTEASTWNPEFGTPSPQNEGAKITNQPPPPDFGGEKWGF